MSSEILTPTKANVKNGVLDRIQLIQHIFAISLFFGLLLYVSLQGQDHYLLLTNSRLNLRISLYVTHSLLFDLIHHVMSETIFIIILVIVPNHMPSNHKSVRYTNASR